MPKITASTRIALNLLRMVDPFGSYSRFALRRPLRQFSEKTLTPNVRKGQRSREHFTGPT
jgi:hypothetical protein